MKSLKIISRIALLSFACMTFHTQADELAVPVGQQGAENAALARPTAGMTQAKVEKTFGEPTKRVEAVGKPPISSWEYPGYVVYFENDRVIHSVLKSDADATTTDAPAAPAAAPVNNTPSETTTQ